MTRRLPVEIAVLWACLSAGISAAQIVSASADLSQRIGGQVYIFGQSNFDATSSLGNDLRRGPDPYFRPSTPEIYIAAASEQDVVQGVKYALDNDAKLSLRGQGHHQSGTSLQPGGVTIDMSNLKAIHIDDTTSACRFQAGLQGIELANETSQHGLHYRVGHAGSNGIAGFTLGGGGGWGGLAVDQITGFDVVNTWEYPEQQLQIKHVSLSSYPDLFFALQGAGQMTGIVVAFYATLQPLREDGLVRVVETVVPLAAASELWAAWLQYINGTAKSPEVEVDFLYATMPSGPALVLAQFDWSPDNRSGTADFLDGWVAIAEQLEMTVEDADMPYLDVILSQSATQQYPGAAHYANSVVVPDVEEGTILEILAAGYANVSSPLSLLVLYPLADTGVKSNADTAYSWRGNYIIYIWAFFTRTAGGAAVDGDAEHVAWVKGIYNQLAEYSLGHYINFVDFEVPEDTQKSFAPANWPRIQAAKATYDPHHLLRELDFYHNDAGRGPLDAALIPVS